MPTSAAPPTILDRVTLTDGRTGFVVGASRSFVLVKLDKGPAIAKRPTDATTHPTARA